MHNKMLIEHSLRALSFIASHQNEYNNFYLMGNDHEMIRKLLFTSFNYN